MGIIIRKALPEDAYEYTLCHISCWRSAFRAIIPNEVFNNMSAEIEQRVQRCKQALIDPVDVEFYCVMYTEKMIGRLIIGKSRDENKPKAGEIQAIYLIEEFWGKGYGKEMLNFALTRLKSMGYNEVILWVLEENHRGRTFYEKHNFICDGAKKEMELGKMLTCLRYVMYL
jgi:GNAT superfamily N-acetyltransferase